MTGTNDRALLLASPLPLAQAWRRALYATTPVEVHERALYTLEATLKYMAAAAAAAWVGRATGSDHARRSCEALVRPSLGQWVAILRSCLADLPENDGITRWIARALSRKIHVTMEGLAGQSVGRVFSDLPAYRNAVVHGAGLPQHEAARRGPRLRELGGQVLRATIGAEAPTLCGSAGGSTVRLVGVGAVVERSRETRPRGSVWLEQNGRTTGLSPLWIFDPDEDDVLVLNKGAGLPKVEYLSYGVPRGGTGLCVWKGPIAAEAGRFLSSATGRDDLEASHVMALVEETEVRALADHASSQWIGPYRIVRRVATGGQGILYQAIQEDPPRRVALKVLLHEAAADETARRRFRSEAATLARVEHAGVVPVYAAGEHEGVPWIAMRFVEGRNLAEVIRSLQGRARRTTLREWQTAAGVESTGDQSIKSHPERMAAIGRDLAQALAACHERGVVHRDVKPANVMVDAEGHVLLTDFGLARTADPRTRTETRRMVGTLHYAAPESLLPAGRRAPDARVDVYGLGATLYELLSHRRPFADHGSDDAALMLAVQVKDPPPLRRIAAYVPRDLEVIVAKAMDKDPERRYTTAAAMADDLERYLRREPIVARPAGRILRVRRWASRRPFVAALLLATAVAVPLLGGVLGYLAASWEGIQRDKRVQRDADIERRLERAMIHYTEWNTRQANDAFRSVLEDLPDCAEAVAGLILNRRSWEEALAELQVHRALKARIPALRRIEALALTKLGRDQEAAAIIARLDPPESPVDFFIAALEANRAEPDDPRRQEEALEFMSRAILASNKPRAIYHLLHARLAGSARNPSHARRAATALMLRWPTSHQAWFCAGYALTMIDDYDQGIPACRKAVEFAPKSAVAWSELGDALTRRIRHAERGLIDAKPDRETQEALLEESYSAYRRAIALRPNLAAAHCNLGAALAAGNRIPEAIEALREAIRLDPGLPRAHANLARALQSAGENPEAADLYRHAIRLDPRDVDARINLGHVLMLLEKKDMAVEVLEEALRHRAPPRVVAIANYDLGVLAAMSGDLRRASACFRRAVRHWPALRKANLHLISALLELDQKDAALEAYREAGSPALEVADDAYWIGRSLFQRGQLEAACRAFRNVLSRDPSHKKARACLATTLMKLGRYREALPDLRRTRRECGSSVFGRDLARRLPMCEQLAELEPKLDDVLSGTYDPGETREAYLLGWIAGQRRRFLVAAELLRTAIERSNRLPPLDGRSARFHAAHAACGVAAGKGAESKEVEASERNAWRTRAIAWLREELDAKLENRSEHPLPETARTELRAWLTDPDLSHVREAKHMRHWSHDERAVCNRLWADVEKALDG